MKKEYPFTSKFQYDQFRKFFPFSCIDILIFEKKKILLTKRKNSPYKGFWHLPGGLIRKKEYMKHAVKRLAKEELGISVNIIKYVGVYESLNEFRHDLSHGFIVSKKNGNIKLNSFVSEFDFFDELPKKTIPHQKIMILNTKKMRIN